METLSSLGLKISYYLVTMTFTVLQEQLGICGFEDLFFKHTHHKCWITDNYDRCEMSVSEWCQVVTDDASSPTSALLWPGRASFGQI